MLWAPRGSTGRACEEGGEAWRAGGGCGTSRRSASAACAGDARAAQASCRPSRRGHGSHSCQRAASVQGPRLPLPVGRPGGASAAPLAPSSAPPRPPSGTLRSSHWEAPTLPLGVPVGASQVPVGVSQVPVGVAKRASKSEWERRGGPRRVPLGPPTGRRATTVRAPLPLGYLPRAKQCWIYANFCESSLLRTNHITRRRGIFLGFFATKLGVTSYSYIQAAPLRRARGGRNQAR